MGARLPAFVSMVTWPLCSRVHVTPRLERPAGRNTKQSRHTRHRQRQRQRDGLGTLLMLPLPAKPSLWNPLPSSPKKRLVPMFAICNARGPHCGRRTPVPPATSDGSRKAAPCLRVPATALSRDVSFGASMFQPRTLRLLSCDRHGIWYLVSGAPHPHDVAGPPPHRLVGHSYPPPPCKPPPPCNLPPPHPGDRHFHVFLVNMCCAGLCCPSALHLLSNTPRACHAN